MLQAGLVVATKIQKKGGKNKQISQDMLKIRRKFLNENKRHTKEYAELNKNKNCNIQTLKTKRKKNEKLSHHKMEREMK